MKYRLLGKTGIKVSELCLGTMTFGTQWGFGCERTEAVRIFEAFTAAGGNFIDTANIYVKGESESILSELIAQERQNLVLATKYSLSESGRVNEAGNSYKNMIQSIEGSLKRLRTDYIDLYYVHAWDFTVAPQELMRNLESLVRSGKVLSIGISDTPAWIASRCNTIAELRGWPEFSAYQVEYCLTEHTVDREIVPFCESQEVTFCGFGPLAAGLLTGKYLSDDGAPKRMVPGKSPRLTPHNLEISRRLNDFSVKIGRPSAQVALRWAMQKVRNSSPIFGARSLAHCEENLGVLGWSLGEAEMSELNSIAAISGHFPNEFLETPRVREVLYGNQINRIEL